VSRNELLDLIWEHVAVQHQDLLSVMLLAYISPLCLSVDLCYLDLHQKRHIFSVAFLHTHIPGILQREGSSADKANQDTTFAFGFNQR